MEESYCQTCGMYDTYICNGDNGGCSECGDTENIIFEPEEECK